MSETFKLELVKNCFNSSWQIYQEIIGSNYMEHREIYAFLRQYIEKNYPHSFSLLELGCGDAIYSAKALSETAIQTYIGVDISETALNLASQNLNTLNCSVELKQQEMWEFLEGCSSTFDLVLISFALHHLSAQKKQALLEQCWQRLNSGGALLIIDVFCREQESRPEYLSRYCGYIQTKWQKLSSESITVVTDHITSSDFPESEATLRMWATKIGFNQVEVLYEGTQDVHKALVLSKTPDTKSGQKILSRLKKFKP